MGCLDVEQTELGQNGGLSQSCLLGNWSERGQPACPILCKYNKPNRHEDDPNGDRIAVPTGEDAAWTPPPLAGQDNHNPDTAIPLFGTMGPECAGHADCGQTIVLAPFDPFQLSTTYKKRAAEIFATYGTGGAKAGTPFFLCDVHSIRTQ
eukprot:SAG11_NODE_1996_length_3947_cov_3.774688_2_plen_150_part_00